MLSTEEQAAVNEGIRAVQRAALAQMRNEPGAWGAVAFVRHLQRGVDQVVAHAVADGATLACTKGCSHCCHMQVHAMAPEVFRIVEALRGWSPDRLNALTDKLRQHADAVRLKSVQDHHAPCPFLQDDLCSIYALRPAVCRKGHSTEVQACASHEPQIPQHLRIVVESEVLMRGTAAAYAELGVATGHHELGQAVLLALNEPQAAARWVAGEAVFEELAPVAQTEPAATVKAL